MADNEIPILEMDHGVFPEPKIGGFKPLEPLQPLEPYKQYEPELNLGDKLNILLNKTYGDVMPTTNTPNTVGFIEKLGNFAERNIVAFSDGFQLSDLGVIPADIGDVMSMKGFITAIPKELQTASLDDIKAVCDSLSNTVFQVLKDLKAKGS